MGTGKEGFISPEEASQIYSQKPIEMTGIAEESAPSPKIRAEADKKPATFAVSDNIVSESAGSTADNDETLSWLGDDAAEMPFSSETTPDFTSLKATNRSGTAFEIPTQPDTKLLEEEKERRGYNAYVVEMAERFKDDPDKMSEYQAQQILLNFAFSNDFKVNLTDKKGLEKVFGTSDVKEISSRIVKMQARASERPKNVRRILFGENREDAIALANKISYGDDEANYQPDFTDEEMKAVMKCVEEKSLLYASLHSGTSQDALRLGALLAVSKLDEDEVKAVLAGQGSRKKIEEVLGVFNSMRNPSTDYTALALGWGFVSGLYSFGHDITNTYKAFTEDISDEANLYNVVKNTANDVLKNNLDLAMDYAGMDINDVAMSLTGDSELYEKYFKEPIEKAGYTRDTFMDAFQIGKARDLLNYAKLGAYQYDKFYAGEKPVWEERPVESFDEGLALFGDYAKYYATSGTEITGRMAVPLAASVISTMATGGAAAPVVAPMLKVLALTDLFAMGVSQFRDMEIEEGWTLTNNQKLAGAALFGGVTMTTEMLELSALVGAVGKKALGGAEGKTLAQAFASAEDRGVFARTATLVKDPRRAAWFGVNVTSEGLGEGFEASGQGLVGMGLDFRDNSGKRVYTSERIKEDFLDNLKEGLLVSPFAIGGMQGINVGIQGAGGAYKAKLDPKRRNIFTAAQDAVNSQAVAEAVVSAQKYGKAGWDTLGAVMTDSAEARADLAKKEGWTKEQARAVERAHGYYEIQQEYRRTHGIETDDVISVEDGKALAEMLEDEEKTPEDRAPKVKLLDKGEGPFVSEEDKRLAQENAQLKEKNDTYALIEDLVRLKRKDEERRKDEESEQEQQQQAPKTSKSKEDEERKKRLIPTSNEARDSGSAFVEVVNRIPDGTKGKKQLVKYANEIADIYTKSFVHDPLEVINLVTLMEYNVLGMKPSEETKILLRMIATSKKAFTALGYEIIDDFVGRPFDSGYTVEIVGVPRIDKTLPPGTEIFGPARRPIIARNGKLIQTGEAAIIGNYGTEEQEQAQTQTQENRSGEETTEEEPLLPEEEQAENIDKRNSKIVEGTSEEAADAVAEKILEGEEKAEEPPPSPAPETPTSTEKTPPDEGEEGGDESSAPVPKPETPTPPRTPQAPVVPQQDPMEQYAPPEGATSEKKTPVTGNLDEGEATETKTPAKPTEETPAKPAETNSKPAGETTVTTEAPTTAPTRSAQALEDRKALAAALKKTNKGITFRNGRINYEDNEDLLEEFNREVGGGEHGTADKEALQRRAERAFIAGMMPRGAKILDDPASYGNLPKAISNAAAAIFQVSRGRFKLHKELGRAAEAVKHVYDKIAGGDKRKKTEILDEYFAQTAPKTQEEMENAPDETAARVIATMSLNERKSRIPQQVFRRYAEAAETAPDTATKGDVMSACYTAAEKWRRRNRAENKYMLRKSILNTAKRIDGGGNLTVGRLKNAIVKLFGSWAKGIQIEILSEEEYRQRLIEEELRNLSEEERKERLEEIEEEEELTGETFGQDSDGFYAQDSKSVVIKEGADIVTVLHETAVHATMAWARENAPELYGALMKAAHNAPQWAVDFVTANYPEVKVGSREFLEEVLAHMVEQRKGDEFRDAMARIADPSVLDKVREWWNKFCDAVMKVWTKMRGTYDEYFTEDGKRKVDLAEILSRENPADVVNGIADAFIKGRVLGDPSVAREAALRTRFARKMTSEGAFLGARASREDGSFITVAPYFDTQATEENTAELAAAAKKKFLNTAKTVADMLGLKIRIVRDNLGGYTHNDGHQVREVSYTIEFDGDPEMDTLRLAAQLLGDIGFEAQMSVIWGKYTKDGGNMEFDVTFNATNRHKIAQILEDAGIKDYTVRNGRLSVLHFAQKEAILNANARLAEVGGDMSKLTDDERGTINYWKETFENLQKAVSQLGEKIYLNSVDSNLGEPKERIEFYDQFLEKLKKGQEDNEESSRYDSGRVHDGYGQGDEGAGNNRPVGGGTDIPRNAVRIREQKRRLREAVEYAKRRAEALDAELEATKRENEEREAAGLEKRKPRALSEDNPWQEGDFDPPLNVDLLDEAERRQQRILERVEPVKPPTPEEKAAIAARGKRLNLRFHPANKRREEYRKALNEELGGNFTFGEHAYKAPNGKPSNLPDELWVLVRTKSFKEWFGDWENDKWHSSVALDENGEPLIVFHGPGELFSKFRVPKEKKSKGFWHDIFYRLDAVFFSDSYDAANSYVHKGHQLRVTFADGSQSVEWVDEEKMEDLEKLLGKGLARGRQGETKDLFALVDPKDEDTAFFLQNTVGGLRYSSVVSAELVKTVAVMPVFLNMRNPKQTDYEGDRWTNDFELKFDKNRYDGHIVTNIRDGGGIVATDYITRNPKAIKSVFNKGTFSKRNADIYKRRGNGYLGDKYSVNARDAMNGGEYPAATIADELGVPVDALNTYLLTLHEAKRGWHHMGSNYEQVEFYDPSDIVGKKGVRLEDVAGKDIKDIKTAEEADALADIIKMRADTVRGVATREGMAADGIDVYTGRELTAEDNPYKRGTPAAARWEIASKANAIFEKTLRKTENEVVAEKERLRKELDAKLSKEGVSQEEIHAALSEFEAGVNAQTEILRKATNDFLKNPTAKKAYKRRMPYRVRGSGKILFRKAPNPRDVFGDVKRGMMDAADRSATRSILEGDSVIRNYRKVVEGGALLLYAAMLKQGIEMNSGRKSLGDRSMLKAQKLFPAENDMVLRDMVRIAKEAAKETLGARAEIGQKLKESIASIYEKERAARYKKTEVSARSAILSALEAFEKTMTDPEAYARAKSYMEARANRKPSFKTGAAMDMRVLRKLGVKKFKVEDEPADGGHWVDTLADAIFAYHKKQKVNDVDVTGATIANTAYEILRDASVATRDPQIAVEVVRMLDEMLADTALADIQKNGISGMMKILRNAEDLIRASNQKETIDDIADEINKLTRPFAKFAWKKLEKERTIQGLDEFFFHTFRQWTRDDVLLSEIDARIEELNALISPSAEEAARKGGAALSEFADDVLMLRYVQERAALTLAKEYIDAVGKMDKARARDVLKTLRARFAQGKTSFFNKLAKDREDADVFANALADAIETLGRDESKKHEGGLFHAVKGQLVGAFSLKQQFEDAIRFCKDPKIKEKAQRAIDKLNKAIADADLKAREIAAANQQWLSTTITEIWSKTPGKFASDAARAREASRLMAKMSVPQKEYAKFSADGKTPLSYAQLLQIYSSIRQEDVRAPFEEELSKVPPPDLDKCEPLLRRILLLDEIEEAVGPQGVQFLDKCAEKYRADAAEVDAVAMRIAGVPLTLRTEDYFPIVRDFAVIRVNAVENALAYLPSVMTPRTSNRRDIDENANVFSVWLTRSAGTAHFIGFGNLHMMLGRVFGNERFSRALRATQGNAQTNQLVEHVRDILSPNLEGAQVGSADKMAGLFTKIAAHIALGGNFLVMARQSSSMTAFALDVGWRKTFSAMMSLAKNPAAAIERMRILWNSAGRRARYQDDEFGIQLELLAEKGGSRLRKSLLRWYMTPNRWGDRIPILLVGQGLFGATEASLQGKINPKTGKVYTKEEAREEALSITWDTIEKTQQTSRVANMSHWQRRGGALARMIGQFQSTTSQYLGAEVRGWRDIIANPKDGKAWRRWIGMIVNNHLFLPGAFTLLGTLWKAAFGDDDDDEKFWEDARHDFIVSCLIGSGSGIFMLGSMITALTTRNEYQAQMAVPAFSVATRTVRGVRKLAKGLSEGDEEKILDGVDKLTDNLAPIRDVKDFFEKVSDD